MQIHARFFVESVQDGRETSTVKLKAVSRGNHNATWAHYTPMGELTMTINNPAVVEEFRRVLRNPDRPPEVELIVDTAATIHVNGDGHGYVAPPEVPEESYAHGRCVEC